MNAGRESSVEICAHFLFRTETPPRGEQRLAAAPMQTTLRSFFVTHTVRVTKNIQSHIPALALTLKVKLSAAGQERWGLAKESHKGSHYQQHTVLLMKQPVHRFELQNKP